MTQQKDLTVLGIDESFTCSGLSVVQNGIPVYVDTVRLASVAGVDKGHQLTFRIKKLFDALDDICDTYVVDAVACERTDWMRNLAARGVNWKQEYAIERRNQEALALLQGALCVYALTNNLEFMLLGVNEWRRELGYGNTKEHVMEMLTVEFPNKFRKVNGIYYWREDDTELDHNAADATGIALVAYHRVNQKRKVVA